MLNSGATARAVFRGSTACQRHRPERLPTLLLLVQSIATFVSVAGLFILLAVPFETHGGERLTLNFNSGWKFLKADPANAERAQFDDSSWATVSAPHTFNDTDTFDNWCIPG